MKRKAPSQLPRPTKRKTASSSWYYAVKCGKNPGVYPTWEECEKQVSGYRGAVFKKFSTENEAKRFVDPSFSPKPAEIIEFNDDVIRVWTDGACKSNGKKGAKAGIGAYILCKGREAEKIAKPLKGERQTNQRAEMMAAFVGLKTVWNRLKEEKDRKDPIKIVLTTDSDHVIKGMTSWMFGWKKVDWNRALINKDLWIKLEKLTEEMKKGDVTVDWKWVKGHSGNEGNETADRLANEGCDM
jgi:ribonuclease HI